MNDGYVDGSMGCKHQKPGCIHNFHHRNLENMVQLFWYMESTSHEHVIQKSTWNQHVCQGKKHQCQTSPSVAMEMVNQATGCQHAKIEVL